MMNKAALKVLTKADPHDGRAGTPFGQGGMIPGKGAEDDDRKMPANTTMLIQRIRVEVQVKLAESIDVHTKAVLILAKLKHMDPSNTRNRAFSK
jgi:hypothetical protein